jgi:hypothetical protein
MRLRVFALEKKIKIDNNSGQRKRTKGDGRNICPSLPRVKRPQNYGFDAHKAASTLRPALTLTKHAK